MRRLLLIGLCASCCPSEPTKSTTVTTVMPAEATNQATPGERHFKDLKQITFGGDNAEAYWSFSGDRLIFQTNRKPYKCDQIEEMPATGGPATLVSTGKGRTTCAYFLKGDQEIIYASTHESSPECPTPPDMSKGYNWGPVRLRHLQGERGRLEPAQAHEHAGLRRRGHGVSGRRLDHLHVDALGRPRAVADGRRRRQPAPAHEHAGLRRWRVLLAGLHEDRVARVAAAGRGARKVQGAARAEPGASPPRWTSGSRTPTAPRLIRSRTCRARRSRRTSTRAASA